MCIRDRIYLLYFVGNTRINNHGLDILRGFEILFALWFTLEIVLRLVFCPNKLDYVKTFSNWVDLFALIPVYLLLISTDASKILMMLNMIRYLRVFRLFKLLYDLHILGKTLQASINQLLILLIILMVPTIMFSSFVYYAEFLGGTEKSKEDFSEIQKGKYFLLNQWHQNIRKSEFPNEKIN